MRIIKKLDWYIMRKFLGTFLLCIALIMAITIVFDLTEKLDKLTEHNAPLSKIIFEYYLNLLPFYFNMFSPLFVFISVILFTSKLAGNSEIIAMQASGISFKRLLYPYFLSATVIAVFIFFFGSYIIPPANKTRLAFENEYVKKYKDDIADNIQMEVEKNVILYIQYFNLERKRGKNMFLEKYEDKKLVSRMTAKNIYWDTLTHWRVEDYTIRNFKGIHEEMTSGQSLDTTINIEPAEMFVSQEEAPQRQGVRGRVLHAFLQSVRRIHSYAHRRVALCQESAWRHRSEPRHRHSAQRGIRALLEVQHIVLHQRKHAVGHGCVDAEHHLRHHRILPLQESAEIRLFGH